MSSRAVAIVGYGCRFPGGAEDPASFWRVLDEGIDATSELPGDRWDTEALHDREPGKTGKMYVRRGGFLARSLRQFDAAFFDISATEASYLDPLHRVTLEVAWEALENASIRPSSLAGSRTGVFMGASPASYNELQARDLRIVGAYSGIGSAVSSVAGNVSHHLRLGGPCLVVDTACSSSLIALQQAIESLRRGESDLALAGGVNLLNSPGVFISFCHAGMLAPDGRCKSFDAAADGYVRAEGCAIAVLKRLDDALRDGDRIAGVVRGIATNHGSGRAITAPHGPAQQAVIRAALADAGVEPAAVSYVEAHGTGTGLGDPIEVHALKAVFGGPRPRPLVLGSVKTNIGHAEIAAGMAGLIKVLLSFEHDTIPRHLHFTRWNPNIDLSGFEVTIPTEPVPWTSAGGPRLAGISSYGFQGTNVHMVVEEPPARPVRPAAEARERPASLLVLSARNEAALRELAGAHGRALDGPAAPGLEELCASAARDRDALEHRAAIVASSTAELRERLGALGSASGVPGVRNARAPRAGAAPVVFLFTGQGSQLAGMGRELYETAPVYRAAFDRCSELLVNERFLDERLPELVWGASRARVDETAVTQPAIFALQHALCELWKSWGIEPAAVMGHSVGEYMALVAAGALAWDAALRLIAERARLMGALPRDAGAMAVVLAPELLVRGAIVRLGLDAGVAIAAMNGPASTTVSGARAAVDTLLEALEHEGMHARRLTVSHAFHSPLMEPMLDAFEAAAARVTFAPPRLPFVSTTTGAAMNLDELASPVTWRRQVREAVRFQSALHALHAAGHRVFLEIGPQPVLLGMARSCLTEAEADACTWLPSLRRGGDDWRSMLDSLGALFTMGVAPRWEGLELGFAVRRRVPLPTYPFQRKSFWLPELAPEATGAASTSASAHPLLGERVPVAGARIHTAELRADAPGFLGEHVVAGTVVVPGAGYVEMVLAALRARTPAAAELELTEVGFESFLPLPDGRGAKIQLTLEESGAFRIHSHGHGHGADLDLATLHAAGRARVIASPSPSPAEVLDVMALEQRIGGTPLLRAEIYAAMSAVGLDYGRTFQGLAQVWRGEHEALARLDLPTPLTKKLADTYVAHPALLDACFQAIGFAVPGLAADPHVPVRAERIRIRPFRDGKLWCHVTVATGSTFGKPIVARVTVWSRRGELLAELDGFVLAPVSRHKLARLLGASRAGAAERSLHELSWTPRTRAASPPPAGRWIVAGAPAPLADGLAGILASAGVTLERVPAADLARALDEAGGASAIRVLSFMNDAGLADVLSIARAAAGFSSRSSTPLTVALITRGAVCTDPGIEPAAPAQAAAWGLLRAAAIEQPTVRWRCLDLDPRELPDQASELVSELAADGAEGDEGDETQVAWRGARRLVARLARAGDGDGGRLERPGLASRVRLGFGERGAIDNLRLEGCPPLPRPDAGWVKVRVRAAGLNFRDVLNVLGSYPGDPGAMGLELAGEVLEVGDGVTRFAPGDRVLGVATSSFESEVLVPELLLAPLPDGLSFEEGATIPVTFLTAHLALGRLAGLRRGERVLVHAGAGGVGMAAIQLARRAGAEIFATAGSEAKRALLRRLGVHHVMDSRSLAFKEQIEEITHGEGIDVVLNSLSGEFIGKSIALLREGGRYLEIGKIGILDEPGIAALNPRARGFVIALDTLTREQPGMIGALLAEIASSMAAGELRPLPHTRFALESARRAYRTMAKGRHIGKIVLTGFHDAPLCRGDGTYLVTGGLGALGLATARWLIEAQGARHLVLVGRGAPSGDARRELASLGAATIHVEQADISDRGAVAALLDRVRAAGPPLRGIFHAAGVLDDALLGQQTWPRLQAVAAPKVQGATHLDELTRTDPIELFVLFSSMASLLGNAGQTSYAAANAALDALAWSRRADGLPALSVSFGPWGEIGMAARLGETLRKQQERAGVHALSTAEGLRLLETAIRRDDIHVGAFTIDLGAYVETVLGGRAPAWLAEAAPAPAPSAAADEPEDDGELRRRLDAAPTHEARVAVWRETIQGEIAALLGLDASTSLDPARDLGELGMDSLLAMELVKRVNRRTRGLFQLAPAMLMQLPTIDALAAHLASAVPVTSAPAPAAPRAPASAAAPALAVLPSAAVVDPPEETSPELERVARYNRGVGSPGQRLVHRLVVAFLVGPVMWLFLRMAFRLRVEGTEHLRGERLILAYRHFYEQDPLLLYFGALWARALRRPALHPSFVTGTFWLETRFRRAVSYVGGSLALVPGDPSWLRRARELLAEGKSATIAIAPTGPIGEARSYVVKPGVARLAADVPDAIVVPVTVEGLQGLRFGPSLFWRRPRITIKLGAPFRGADVGGEGPEQIAAICRRVRREWELLEKDTPVNEDRRAA